jgi:hypothetical protein
MLIVASVTGNLSFTAIQPQKQRRWKLIIEKKTRKGQKSWESPHKKTWVTVYDFPDQGFLLNPG